MFSFWSHITKSVDDYRQNSKIGGWGGPASVWNPKQTKKVESETDIADLTGEPKKQTLENYRNNLKVGGWGGPASVWNPKQTKKVESDTDIADLTGEPKNNYAEFNVNKE